MNLLNRPESAIGHLLISNFHAVSIAHPSRYENAANPSAIKDICGGWNYTLCTLGMPRLARDGCPTGGATQRRTSV